MHDLLRLKRVVFFSGRGSGRLERTLALQVNLALLDAAVRAAFPSLRFRLRQGSGVTCRVKPPLHRVGEFGAA